jgi:hypothetical protein
MQRTFFKAGKVYINMANVTFARRENESTVSVYFAATSDHGAMKVDLRGADGQKFLEKLDHWSSNE